MRSRISHAAVLLTGLMVLCSGRVDAQTFEPSVGQAGKDVVWVPTSPALVEKMLDLAKITPNDLVMDLGSGDGRNIIAAAKRGARAIGVEYNPDMVELSRRLAKEAGVADKATFIQGDMYEADISKANVLALFLLPSNLNKLQEKFLALEPGSRIVNNTFFVEGWEPDVQETIDRRLHVVVHRGALHRPGQGRWCLAVRWRRGGAHAAVSETERGDDSERQGSASRGGPHERPRHQLHGQRHELRGRGGRHPNHRHRSPCRRRPQPPLDREQGAVAVPEFQGSTVPVLNPNPGTLEPWNPAFTSGCSPSSDSSS